MPKSIELEKRVRSSPQRRSHLVVLTLRNLSPNRSQKRPIYHLNCESQARFSRWPQEPVALAFGPSEGPFIGSGKWLFVIRESKTPMRNRLFLIRGSTLQMRIWPFLIRESQTPMRNRLFLIGESALQIRNWLFLITEGQTPMRNGLFLIGESALQIRNQPFLITERQTQMKKGLFLIDDQQKNGR